MDAMSEFMTQDYEEQKKRLVFDTNLCALLSLNSYFAYFECFDRDFDRPGPGLVCSFIDCFHKFQI